MRHVSKKKTRSRFFDEKKISNNNSSSSDNRLPGIVFFVGTHSRILGA